MRSILLGSVWATALALCLAPVAWSAPVPVAGEAGLFAERITEDNLSRVRVAGPDAIGGLGDWALGNGVLCAVVSDPSHESILSSRGGVLVDLAHCGLADDQWISLQPVFNISQENVPPVQQISAGTSDGEARVVTQGAFDGLVFTTTYTLDTKDPEAIRISTRLRRVAAGGGMRLLGDIALHGSGSMAPFTLSTRHPELSLGFRHPEVDPFKPLELLRAIVPADFHVIVGGDALEPGISYGLRLTSARIERSDGSVDPLPIVSINGIDFTMLGVLPRPYWFGGEDAIGFLELAQIYFMDLDEGDAVVFEREIRVGRRADVASVTDAVWPDLPRVHGTVDEPAIRIHVDRADGTPVTQVRPGRDGRFAFRAPEGNLTLRVRGPARRRMTQELALTQAGADLGEISLEPAPRVQLPRDQPARIAFAPQEGTMRPRFGDQLLGFRIGSERVATSRLTNDVSLGGIAGDPREVLLPIGSYDVFATRGPEYSVTRVGLSLDASHADKPALLPIARPTRVLETPGWMSADLHIHSLLSDDSSLPLDERLRTILAADLEIAVSTEHDMVADYAPAIRSLGASNRVASVIGSEITSTSKETRSPHTAGHLNALPLPHRPEEYRGGALNGEAMRIREIAAELRALGGQRVLQLNHPRGDSADGGAGQYFSHLSVAGSPFDPSLPLDAEPNHFVIERDAASKLRDLDFDAVELLNGPSMHRYYLTRADWFSLLLQGEVRTATANADSHRLGEIMATPRNYVRLPFDSVAEFDEGAFVEAVLAGRLYGTTGPILDVRLGEAEIGDTLRGTSATLEVGVRAAHWVPVSRARVFVNAVEVAVRDIKAGGKIELPLTFAADSFVTVEVEGDLDGEAGEIFRAVQPEFASFAFTNPIFVDADSDGEWTAPGLPETLPPTLSDPESFVLVD